MSDFEEYCSSKLYVRGNDLDPAHVTKLLGVTPDRAHRRGDQSFRVRPDDGSLTSEPTGLVHNRGMWRLAIDSERRKLWDAEAQLEYWCGFLEQRDVALRNLQSQGYEVKLDFYIDEGPVVYLRFAPELLQRLAHLKIRVDFGIYDGTSPELRPAKDEED